MTKIKHREALLAELVYQLETGKDHGGRYFHEIPLVNLKVSLYEGKDKICDILGAMVALRYLVEDIYTDSEYDWSEATRLDVSVY